jgi:hypothetical protein
VHHRVDPFEVGRRQVPDVHTQGRYHLRLRTHRVIREQTAVDTYDVVAGFPKQWDEPGADVAVVSRDENAHEI